MRTLTGTGTFTMRSGGQCKNVMFSTCSVTAFLCTIRGCAAHMGSKE